jgi:hypothetical protein
VRWREKCKKRSNNMFRARVRSRFNDAFCSHVRAALTVRFMSVSANNARKYTEIGENVRRERGTSGKRDPVDSGARGARVSG